MEQGGLPSEGISNRPEMVLSGVTPQGPRFENLGALRDKEKIQAEGAVQTEQYKLGTKLGGLSRRLNVLRKQYDTALPESGVNSELMQRFSGPFAMIGAKTGIVPNKTLIALQKNARLQAIQVIKMAGEAGNLAQQEQEEASKAITSEGLTMDERMASTKQFLEVAIAGMSKDALDFVSRDPAFMKVVEETGVDKELVGLPNISNGVNLDNVNKLIQASGLDLGGATIKGFRFKDAKKK